MTGIGCEGVRSVIEGSRIHSGRIKVFLRFILNVNYSCCNLGRRQWRIQGRICEVTDPVCPERMDPDPVCPEMLDPDPVNIRPDPQPYRVSQKRRPFSKIKNITNLQSDDKEGKIMEISNFST